jgi:cell division protein FtsN
MASNYKSAPAKPSRWGPMMTGIAVGVLLGVLLALGFALWLNRNANPFVEKSKAVDALPARTTGKFDATQPGGVPQPVREPGDKTKGDEKPRFEFYQILPGEKDAKGKAAAKAESKPAPPSVASAAPSDAVTSAKEARKEIYMLQAGAFQNESDAESLKAKIAFAGMEATVRSVNLPDKGTLYRVRLGPYRSIDEVNRIKTALSQNGIAAAVVKPD